LLGHDGQVLWVAAEPPGGARSPAVGTGSTSSAPPEPGTELRAPMTGRISQVAAAPGDAVAAGDLLLIIEAMKMEYRLLAPRAGVIEAIDGSPGSLVEAGRVLVRFAG
jgi:biotin carboxyl carrier protein